MLAYLFGLGSNGKSSFGEAIAHALGDYAHVFNIEVLIEAKGERHPTELAQFKGVRFALTTETPPDAYWNDSRVKQMTGDAMITARLMRGDFFQFKRTHKTIMVANHMPSLRTVTHAIARRVQMVPCRAVFVQVAGAKGIRERLKAEAGGAILAWIVEGARMWLKMGTKPPQAVMDLTKEYLSDQDIIAQWLAERCDRTNKNATERSSDLHRDYIQWCEREGHRAQSAKSFSPALVAAGVEKLPHCRTGKLFAGIALRARASAEYLRAVGGD